ISTLDCFSGEGAESCQDRAVASARGRGCGKSCLLDQDCPTKRQCLCDGQCGWSCIMPTRSCPWPLSFPYSTSLLLSPSPSFSSLVQTRCDPGFKMADGTELVTRRCQGDRSWSGAEPVCMAKPTESPPLCPPLGQIENGITLQDRNSSEYTCHPGFRLIGSRENFCLENGSWQYPEPICEQVFCPPPADVAAGYLVAVQRSRYEVGEVIYYLCRKGFLLDGPNRVVCESDGSWGHTPFCRGQAPPLPQHCCLSLFLSLSLSLTISLPFSVYIFLTLSPPDSFSLCVIP
ncbi:SVEP1 protein, partial [Amia calva]|nr:SVEP1 protein [Amia calva]